MSFESAATEDTEIDELYPPVTAREMTVLEDEWDGIKAEEERRDKSLATEEI